MIQPGIEDVSPSRPPAAGGERRMVYSFRRRNGVRTDDVAAVLAEQRRALRGVRAGTAEAAEIHREIGRLLARGGRVREAIEASAEAVSAARAARDRHQTARALEAMGMLHARRGEFERDGGGEVDDRAVGR